MSDLRAEELELDKRLIQGKDAECKMGDAAVKLVSRGNSCPYRIPPNREPMLLLIHELHQPRSFKN